MKWRERKKKWAYDHKSVECEYHEFYCSNLECWEYNSCLSHYSYPSVMQANRARAEEVWREKYRENMPEIDSELVRRQTTDAWMEWDGSGDRTTIQRGDMNRALPPGYRMSSDGSQVLPAPWWLDECWILEDSDEDSVWDNVKKGLHPLGAALHSKGLHRPPGRPSCGSCRHPEVFCSGGGVCDKQVYGDVDFKWGACVHWESRDAPWRLEVEQKQGHTLRVAESDE